MPVSKLLLDVAEPLPLAAFLYLGSAFGFGLWGFSRALVLGSAVGRAEAPLGRRDLPRMAAITAAGGVAAPFLLMWGQVHTAGVTASLLMNLEGVFTALLAWLLFREHVGWRVGIAAVLAMLGGAWLTAGDGAATTLGGALAVAGAFFFWALDNNLTQGLSGRDPITLGFFKSLAGGVFMLALATVFGQPFPSARGILGALAVGALSYGASLVCILLAIRGLGASRAMILFGLSPFAGVLVAVLILPGERLGLSALAAGVLMGVSSWLLVTERHEHAHVHAPMAHEHRHVHDAHHPHAHTGGEGPEPHSHPHRHARLEHGHPHAPDLHHRHGH